MRSLRPIKALPHMTDVSPLSWEEVYAGWKREDLMYYWTKVEFKKIRRYWGYAQKGFAEALQLARKRYKRGILALRRVIKSSPTSGDADKPRSVLQEIGALEQGAVRGPSAGSGRLRANPRQVLCRARERQRTRREVPYVPGHEDVHTVADGALVLEAILEVLVRSGDGRVHDFLGDGYD